MAHGHGEPSVRRLLLSIIQQGRQIVNWLVQTFLASNDDEDGHESEVNNDAYTFVFLLVIARLLR
jgi:hypothetical protein